MSLEANVVASVANEAVLKAKKVALEAIEVASKAKKVSVVMGVAAVA